MFNHIDIELPQLERETIDGVRYYDLPNGNKKLIWRPIKMLMFIWSKNLN